MCIALRLWYYFAFCSISHSDESGCVSLAHWNFGYCCDNRALSLSLFLYFAISSPRPSSSPMFFLFLILMHTHQEVIVCFSAYYNIWLFAHFCPTTIYNSMTKEHESRALFSELFSILIQNPISESFYFISMRYVWRHKMPLHDKFTKNVPPMERQREKLKGDSAHRIASHRTK